MLFVIHSEVSNNCTGKPGSFVQSDPSTLDSPTQFKMNEQICAILVSNSTRVFREGRVGGCVGG